MSTEPTPAELRAWKDEPQDLLANTPNSQPAMFRDQLIHITPQEAAWLRKRGHARWCGVRCCWYVDSHCAGIEIRFTPKEAR